MGTPEALWSSHRLRVAATCVAAFSHPSPIPSAGGKREPPKELGPPQFLFQVTRQAHTGGQGPNQRNPRARGGTAAHAAALAHACGTFRAFQHAGGGTVPHPGLLARVSSGRLLVSSWGSRLIRSGPAQAERTRIRG